MQQDAIGLGVAIFLQVLPSMFQVATGSSQLQLQMRLSLIK